MIVNENDVTPLPPEAVGEVLSEIARVAEQESNAHTQGAHPDELDTLFFILRYVRCGVKRGRVNTRGLLNELARLPLTPFRLRLTVAVLCTVPASIPALMLFALNRRALVSIALLLAQAVFGSGTTDMILPSLPLMS